MELVALKSCANIQVQNVQQIRLAFAIVCVCMCVCVCVCVCVCERERERERERELLSCVQFFATPWTVACQAPLPMGFSRQEHWSG